MEQHPARRQEAKKPKPNKQNKKTTTALNQVNEIATSDEDDLLRSPARGETSTPKAKVDALKQAATNFANRNAIAGTGLIKEPRLTSTPMSGAVAAQIKQTTTSCLFGAGLPSTSTTKTNTNQNASNVAIGAQNKSTFAHGTNANVKPKQKHNEIQKNMPRLARSDDSASDTGGAAFASTPVIAHNRPSTSNSQGINELHKKIPKRRGGRKYQMQKQNQLLYAQNTPVQKGNQNQPLGIPNNSNKYLLGPSTGGFHERVASVKRQRVKGDTPPEITSRNKVAKRTDKRLSTSTTCQLPSMADVVKDSHLLVAIIDMPIPGIIIPFSQENYKKIYQAITSFVAAEISKSIAIPTFDENTYVRGIMRVRCSTQGARTWLESAIPYIPKLWNNMSLQLIDYDKIPTPHKLLGLFPNCDLDCNTICKVLQEQNNSQIDVGRWSILSNKKSHIGTHIAFAVSEDQYEIVRGLGFKLYFGAARASFKDLSEKVRPNTAQIVDETTETSEMDVTEPSDEETTIVENIRKTSLETEPPETEGDAHQQIADSAPMDTTTTDEQPTAQQTTAGAEVNTEKNIQQSEAQNTSAPMDLNVETTSDSAQLNTAGAEQPNIIL